MKGNIHLKKILIILILALSCLFPVRVMAEPEAVEQSVEDSINTEEYENVFETLFDKVYENLPEVLSAVTLCASLIVAFAYKRGLLPLVRGSLRAIGDTVTRIENEKNEDGESIRSFDLQVSGEPVDYPVEA